MNVKEIDMVLLWSCGGAAAWTLVAESRSAAAA
jgi:hypothetical protein